MLFEIIVLLASVPAGLLVSFLARDELIAGRKWFLSLMILSFVFDIAVYFLNFTAGALTCAFIFIFTTISYLMSWDGRWTKKKG